MSLTHAFVALTLDIISRVCFGYSFDFLELDGFAKAWHANIVVESRFAHCGKQFPWLFEGMRRLKLAQARSGMKRQLKLMRHVKTIIKRHKSAKKLQGGASTIFDTMSVGS